MKKLLFISMLFEMCVISAQAQMADLMGSIAVDGAMNQGAVQSVGYANNRLKSTQLISDINMKMAEIIMSHDGNYQRMPVQNMTSGGVKVTFKPYDQGRAVEARMEGLNQSVCVNVLSAPWENVSLYRVENGSGAKEFKKEKAASMASNLCQKAKTVSLIFQ